MARLAPDLSFLQPRERFIPVQVPALTEKICADPTLTPSEGAHLRLLSRLLQARFHFEFLGELERLKELYDPFNPDRDTLPLWEVSSEKREKHFEEFRQGVERILTQSNFCRLSREQLLACLEAENPWGVAVKVNLGRFKVLDVFYRGVREETVSVQPWHKPFKRETRQQRRLSRVAVLVRKTDGDEKWWVPWRRVNPGPDYVLLKLFKNVLLEELKMTSPDIRVKMRLIDRAKIALTVLTGVATSAAKFLMAVAINPILLFTVLTGCAGAFLRGIYGFIACRTRYMERLTSHLYYQCLANNLSALTRLFDMAEAEEFKEALLAYYILYKYRTSDLTMEELDQKVEAWLAQEFGLPRVDFEVDGAVRKLLEKGLLVELTEDELHALRQEQGGSSAPTDRPASRSAKIPPPHLSQVETVESPARVIHDREPCRIDAIAQEDSARLIPASATPLSRPEEPSSLLSENSEEAEDGYLPAITGDQSSDRLRQDKFPVGASTLTVVPTTGADSSQHHPEGPATNETLMPKEDSLAEFTESEWVQESAELPTSLAAEKRPTLEGGAIQSGAPSPASVCAAPSADTPPRVILKVYDLPSALRRLDEWWDQYFMMANVGRAEDDRLAL